MNQEYYRKLISGKGIGPADIILRGLLWIAAQIYQVIIRLRNFLYSKGWLKTYRVNVPVISIGNITAGGTGKTPLVIWLYNQINHKSKNCRIAVLTRGYKTTQNSELKTQNYSDEPAILAESCPQAKVIVNPDRFAAANEAVNKFAANMLIMDDGFQHRRLARDLDIVAIDATCPFGYDRILPAGLLREPVTSLKRADAVVITHSDQVSKSELTKLEEKLLSIHPNIIIAQTIHAPLFAKSCDGKTIDIAQLNSKKIFAFCGIGNPNAFFNTLKKLGACLVGSKIYNDHHKYRVDDITDIYEEARYLNADIILTTQKDWTKIYNLPFSLTDSSQRTFAYLIIEMKFTGGEDKISRLIEKALVGTISQK